MMITEILKPANIRYVISVEERKAHNAYFANERNALAEDYRFLRRIDGRMARLVWKRYKAVEAELDRHMAEAIFA